MIADNSTNFIDLIDKSISLTKDNNINYFNLLNKEALNNTWEQKALLIINLLKKYENN